MMVAIPGLMMAHVAKRWRNEYVAFITRLEGITLRHFRPRFAGEMTRVAAKPRPRQRGSTEGRGPTEGRVVAPC